MLSRFRAQALASTSLALLLAGCAGADFAPFGRRQALVPTDSVTVQRVMGRDAEVPPLLPEGGNVWPGQEPPRATLANPDVPVREPVPPSEGLTRAERERGRPPEPPLRSAEPGPNVPPQAAPQPRNYPPGRRGSTTPPGVSEPLNPTPPPRSEVAPGEPATPPERRLDGRVIPVPGGGPGITTGGTRGMQTYIAPGGGTGTAIPQGSTTTLIGPDGQVQVVPTPR